MENEKRLIELCRTACTPENCEKYGHKPCFECVAEYLIANDVVPVVRCKDCRFSAQHDLYDAMECMKWTTKWGVAYTTPDGHCHKGEREDNG